MRGKNRMPRSFMNRKVCDMARAYRTVQFPMSRMLFVSGKNELLPRNPGFGLRRYVSAVRSGSAAAGAVAQLVER